MEHSVTAGNNIYFQIRGRHAGNENELQFNLFVDYAMNVLYKK